MLFNYKTYRSNEIIFTYIYTYSHINIAILKCMYLSININLYLCMRAYIVEACVNIIRNANKNVSLLFAKINEFLT